MKLAERLKALQQNQESWKSRLSREKSEDVLLARKSLDCRRSELVQASDDWRKRLRTDTDVGSGNTTAASRPTLRAGYKAGVVRNCASEYIPRLPTTTTTTKPAACSSEDTKSSNDKENTCLSLLSTPRRVIPRPAATRRPPSRLAKISGSSNESGQNCQSSSSLKRCFELGEEFNHTPTNHVPFEPKVENNTSKRATPFKPPPPEAFQTPVVGKEHCGVRLRELDTKCPFPEVMLIRAKGSRQSEMSVRLVCPSSQNLQSASYLLVTRKRLIVFNSENSTVSERAKVSQMAYEIIAGKEMACTAPRLEIANDDPVILAAFHRAIGGVGKQQQMNADEESEEEADHLEDVVYLVVDSTRMQVVAKGQPPSANCFDADKILVFDFVTEVYVWIGRNADRELIRDAVDQAKQLTRSSFSPLAHKIFCIPLTTSPQSTSANWTILRKFSQGIVDCLFRHKFENYPANTQLHTPSNQQSIIERPWSVPAAPHLRLDSSRRFTSAFSSRSIGIEVLLKDDEEMVVQLAGSFPTSKPPPINILHLEGLDLRHTDENLFTEQLLFYQLHGEQLTQLNTLEELDDQSCYVLEWNYRVEREGVRKLNGQRISYNHETGRQRQVFFYWLGSRSSIKDQSKCALALRDHDKARQEHIRVEQGLEPAIFLSLLDGKMVVKGAGTGWFLVIGGQDLLLYSAEELYMPVELRTQSAYIQVLKDQQQIVMWKGEDCPERVLEASKRFAIKMARLRQVSLDESSFKDLKYVSQINNFPLLKPKEWNVHPRFIRIYGNEGHELRDCMLVDQGNHLWIWAESTSGPVTTFALRVAHYYWKKKTLEKDTAIVISEGAEPNDFKALFPTWKEPVLPDGCDDPSAPRLLEELLHERTKSRTIEELKLRNLPKGCDTKHLERYLTDSDFELTFGFTKVAYGALPRWKQISLKKIANLF